MKYELHKIYEFIENLSNTNLIGYLDDISFNLME